LTKLVSDDGPGGSKRHHPSCNAGSSARVDTTKPEGGTQSLTSARGARLSTKRTPVLVAVIAVVIIVAAGAGILLTGHPSGNNSSSVVSTTSTGSTGPQPFVINYDQLIVGYQGGLFQIGFQGTGTEPIAGLVVLLSTKVPAAMCTGFGGIALGFGNCTPGPKQSYTYTASPGGSFPANSTFSGIDTGAGPGSAVVGQSYPVSITVTFVNGTTVVQNISVQASAGS
jgi:hypothetical protein